jgi:Fe-S cluster biogenesis protein NfuA
LRENGWAKGGCCGCGVSEVGIRMGVRNGRD